MATDQSDSAGINPNLLVPHPKGERLPEEVAKTMKGQLSLPKITKTKEQRRKERREKQLQLRSTPHEYTS